MVLSRLRLSVLVKSAVRQTPPDAAPLAQEALEQALPDGSAFAHSDEHPMGYLHHKYQCGEFSSSSDSLGHTYRRLLNGKPVPFGGAASAKRP